MHWLLLDSSSYTNSCYGAFDRKHVVVVLFADAYNASWELSRWSQTEKLIGGNVVFNETVMDGVCSWDRWSVPSSQQWPMLWWSKVLQILVPWLVSPSNNKLFFFYAMRQFRSESLDEILFVVPLMRVSTLWELIVCCLNCWFSDVRWTLSRWFADLWFEVTWFIAIGWYVSEPTDLFVPFLCFDSFDIFGSLTKQLPP